MNFYLVYNQGDETSQLICYPKKSKNLIQKTLSATTIKAASISVSYGPNVSITVVTASGVVSFYSIAYPDSFKTQKIILDKNFFDELKMPSLAVDVA